MPTPLGMGSPDCDGPGSPPRWGRFSCGDGACRAVGFPARLELRSWQAVAPAIRRPRKKAATSILLMTAWSTFAPAQVGSVWLINRVATVMSATKNPPDGLIERVSSKEVPRRLREPRGPDHSNGSGHSNTGKKPAIAGKNARADGNSGAKTTLN